MSVIFLLLVVSLVVALGFLGAFIWAVRKGQYDDVTTPSMRILTDDTVIHQPVEPTGKKEK